MNHFHRKRISILTTVALLMASFFMLADTATKAKAAPFSKAYIRYDRMHTSTATNVLIVVKPITVATEAKLLVTFATNTTVAASLTLTTTALPTGVTALPGTLSGTGSGQVATITGVTDLTVGTEYGVNISVGITTNTATGAKQDSVKTQTAGSADIDTANIASYFVANDQIAVTATVLPIFTFVLSANSADFGNLSTSAVTSTPGVTVSVATNGNNGWTGWVKSANAGLTSATNSKTIATTGTIDATPSTLSTGSEGYVLDVDKTTTGTGSGSLTVDAEYNGATTSAGGTLSTTLQPIGGRTGYTNGDVFTLIGRATISNITPSGTDYVDTWTVIGCAKF